MEARDRQQHQHFVHYYLKLHLENKLNTALGTIQNDNNASNKSDFQFLQ